MLPFATFLNIPVNGSWSDFISGVNCSTNINECSRNPCVFGQCRDLINSYVCVCDPQYTGTNCNKKMDPCNHNLCQNNAQCVPQANYTSYYCNCSGYGFQGTCLLCPFCSWQTVLHPVHACF